VEGMDGRNFDPLSVMRKTENEQRQDPSIATGMAIADFIGGCIKVYLVYRLMIGQRFRVIYTCAHSSREIFDNSSPKCTRQEAAKIGIQQLGHGSGQLTICSQ
jgi:hypothetical protein